MTTIYLGIDNGITGGLCAISQHPSAAIIAMCPTPTQRTRKGIEIDVKKAWAWIEATAPALDNVCVVIEEPGGSKSAKAGASMAASFTALRVLCDLKGLRYHRITPQSWQKGPKSLLNAGTGDTKPAALRMARAVWPDETWLATDRCSVPHDGMIDAALIAEYARRNQF